MTFEQLRIFLACAGCDHPMRATGTLNRTRSAAGAALRTRKGQHATSLFHRVQRGQVLTETGWLFRDEARGTLA